MVGMPLGKIIVVDLWGFFLSRGTFLRTLPSNIIEMRSQHKEAFQKKHGVKLGFMSPFVKAAAFALQDQPVVNAGG